MVDTSIQRFPNLKAGQGQLGTAKWALLILSSYDSYDRYCWQVFLLRKWVTQRFCSTLEFGTSSGTQRRKSKYM